MNDYKCQKCGCCCRSFTIMIDINDAKNGFIRKLILDKLFNLLGIRLNEIGPTEIIQHGNCKHFNKQTKVCMIYDEKRPEVCKKYLCFKDCVPVHYLRLYKRVEKMANGDPQKITEIMKDLLTEYDKKLMAEVRR